VEKRDIPRRGKKKGKKKKEDSLGRKGNSLNLLRKARTWNESKKERERKKRAVLWKLGAEPCEEAWDCRGGLLGMLTKLCRPKTKQKK